MTHLKFILYIVFVLSLGNAFGQTHIYEHYASRTDLEVAYLENVPLDSSTSVNATIIIAKDSAAWEWLKDEFRIVTSMSFGHTFYQQRRNKYDPTKFQKEDIPNSCFVFANLSQKRITIFQYETINQYYTIIRYLIKRKIYEKD